MMHSVLKFLRFCLCLFTVCLLLPVPAAQAANVRDTDASTVDQWENLVGFKEEGKSTLFSGGVWTDKSVFLDAPSAKSALGLSGDLSTADPEHFLAVLSAISSTKSIHGRYAVPTDTVFVLDMSGSMTAENRLDHMVPALNSAIGRLLELNVENRVSVVLYYGLETDRQGGGNPLAASPAASSHVMLGLDRYLPTDGNYLNLSYKEDGDSDKYGEYTVSVVAKTEQGTALSPKPADFVVHNNATYIQNGLLRAWEEVFSKADTIVGADGDELQRGRSRLPILVLMSDGAPTSTTTSFTSITAANGGNNRVATSHHAMGFVTQLTASWVRQQIRNHYHNDGYGYQPLVYTLGLSLEAQQAKPAYVARKVMDPFSSPRLPAGEYFTDEKTSDQLWKDYLALANQTGKTMTLTFQKPGTSSNGAGEPQTLTYNAEAINQHYVDRYFSASSSGQLSSAFDNIVDEIIIQSLYYPTDVEENEYDHDGYLTFTDRIGEHMEVKDVKGLILSSTLYTGENFARQLTEGFMGTPDNPTGMGDDFIRSVRIRLGIDRDTAQKLVDDAWNDGQLHYDASTGAFSNFVTWFADGDGKFIKGWTGLAQNATPTPVPSNAAFRIRSYGFLDDVTHHGLNSNLMYVSVQIRTEINPDGTDGDSIVMLKVPASLIPLIKTEIRIDNMGTSAESYSYTRTEATPIRLLYEVGLEEEINPYSVASIAGSEHLCDDGSYIFYTNEYDLEEITELKKAQQAGSETDPHENTLAYFSPSLENERYYYNTDTYLYQKDGDRYSLYTGGAPSAGGTVLYAPYTVYHLNGTAHSGQATQEILYLEVSAAALNEARQESGTGAWYLPIHTVRRYTNEFNVIKEKQDQITPVTDVLLPVIHRHDAEYHSAMLLGNNGYIKMAPQVKKLAVRARKEMTHAGSLTHGLDGFTFQLQDSAGNAVATAVSAADGSIVFPELSYDGRDAGKTFTYILSEVPGNENGVLYSTQTYTLEVNVGWDVNQPDKLEVSAVWQGLAPGEVPVFTNTYTLYAPPTGDDTPIILLSALAILSISGTLMLIQRKKRIN